jgi:cysteine desulfurase
MRDLIYLDNNATTQIDPRVLEAMMPFLVDRYANAASNHEFGISTNQAVRNARTIIAEAIGAESNEIIFTSGATEAINLAIKGIAHQTTQKGNHIITSETEHPAVLDSCQYMESIGYDVTYLKVQNDGILDLEILKANLRDDTVLVSVMFANNEIGVIQPIKAIAELAHSKGAFFMTDATQALGKMDIKVDQLGIDLLTFTAHKIHGPKGIGGLFTRSRRPNKVKLSPIIHGGGHERGMRSGTINVPGAIGLAKSIELACKEMKANETKIRTLRDKLEFELLKVENSHVNGNELERLYNVSNICFNGVDADAIMVGLKAIMVSNGSACTSTKVEPSHVLKAIGLSDEEAYSSIRFSLGKFNTELEIVKTIAEVKRVVDELKVMVK